MQATAGSRHVRAHSVGSGPDSPVYERRSHTPPPRSPLQRTSGAMSPLCPSSPRPVFGGTPLGSPRSQTPPRSSVACNAFAYDVAPVDRIVSSTVYESNIAAAVCFAQYNDWGPGGVTAQPAPPLVDEPDIELAPPAAMTSARSEPAMSRPSLPGMPVSTRGTANVHGLPRHGSTGVGLGHYGIGPAGAAAAVVGADRTALAASVNDVDFGLATCLATPMDPVEAETRPFGLPSATTTATTTAAARTAAVKLNSANDILNNASRYGDWVRRARRRKRLEVLQGVLATLGTNVVLGKLVDDTLHDYGGSSSSRGIAATAAVAASGGGASAASRSSSFRGSAACSAGGAAGAAGNTAAASSAGGASICEMPSFRHSASGAATDASHGGGGGAADATAAAAAPATPATSVLTKQSSFAGFSPAGLAAAATAAAGAGASAFAFSSVGSDGVVAGGGAAGPRGMSAFASVGHHLQDLDEDHALGASAVLHQLQLGQDDVMRVGRRGDQEELQQRRQQQQQEEDEFGSCVDGLVEFPTFRDDMALLATA